LSPASNGNGNGNGKLLPERLNRICVVFGGLYGRLFYKKRLF